MILDDIEEVVVEHEANLSEPQMDVTAARTAMVLDMAGQGAGKTDNIGFRSGYFITEFPEAKGFIAANTYLQLTQSTLNKGFKVWDKYFGLTEYDAKSNPDGDFVLDKQPPSHFKRFERLKNYNSTISFKDGCLVFVGSLDNFKAHDGKEFAWAELDETKDTKKEALTTVILARLRQYGLWTGAEGDLWDNTVTLEEASKRGLVSWNPCCIHSSPAEGGVDWILELFNLNEYEEEIRKVLADPYQYFYKQDKQTTTVIYQTYWNEENLPPGYIESRKSQLSENEQLKFIDGFPFSKNGGEYYPHFSRKLHVGNEDYYKPGSLSHLTYDFNSSPYITQIRASVEYITRFWHEKEKRKCYEQEPGTVPFDVMRIAIYQEDLMRSPYNSTEHAAQKVADDIEPGTYPDILVHGDATGRNRITGMGDLTQYKIIEGKLAHYLPTNWLQVGKTNVANLKRRDLFNRIFEGKIPEVEFIIHESCKETIRDFEYLKEHPDGSGKYKEKAKDPNTGKEYEKIGHISDAVEYLICDLCKQYLRIF